MSGILDNKKRMVDVFVTQQGRQQMSNGDMRISYVSFTDGDTYYRGDIASGSADATNRFFLEASNAPQDQITFETDDSGLLKPFPNSLGVSVAAGKIVSYSFTVPTGSVFSGSLDNTTVLSSTAFAYSGSKLLDESLNNFAKLRSIGTRNSIFDDDSFAVGPDNVEYVISDTRPVQDIRRHVQHIDQIESIFEDARFSNVKNFAYLPPINRIDDETIDKTNVNETSKFQLGYYPPWGHNKRLTYAQLNHELMYYERLGFSRTFTIDPTSRDNRLIAQMFEQSSDTLRKLDTVDLGRFQTGNENNPTAHVFLAGKMLTDSTGVNKFVHLFTLVFN